MKKFIIPIVLSASIFPLISNASKVETYNCDDGSKIKISFVGKNRAVAIYPDDVIVLDQVKSASGARYVGEGTQIWESKGEVNIASLTSEEEATRKVAKDSGINCKVN